MAIESFTAAANNNFRSFSEHPCYRLGVRSLDNAYQAAIRCLPSEGYPILYGRFVLICHKHMVSAANLIASCLPEDAAGITRRAVETAELATAIRLNDANKDIWLNFQDRHDRWLRRQQGERPKPLRVQYEGLKGDEITESLRLFLGMLSDAYVHFTPEFYSVLNWRVEVNEDDTGGKILLDYFQSDVRELERHFILLLAVHGKIFQALDRCFDGYLYQQPPVKTAVDELWHTAKSLNGNYTERYGTRAVPEAEAEEAPGA